MARRNVRGIMFAMEDMETNEVVDNGGELEGTVGEINEDGNEIENDINSVDSAIDDVDTLENIGGVMADSIEQGEGLDPNAAKMADVAIEAICARLGFEQPKCIYSLEAFGSKHSRVAATNVALEFVKINVKETLKGIGKWIEEIINNILLFFRKVGAGAIMLKKNVTGLHSKIEKSNIESTTKKGGSFDDQGLANAFQFGKQGDGYAAITKILGNAKKMLAAKSSFASLKLENGLEVKAFKQYNGMVFVDGEVFRADDSNAQPIITWVKPNDTKVSTSTCPILSKDEMVTILVEAGKVADEIQTFIKMESELKRNRDAAIKAIQDSLNENSSDYDKESVSDRKAAIKSGFTAYSSLLHNVPRLGVNTVSAVMKYCKKSFSQYDKVKD